uniref:Putative secreted protein n=1 Tax=Anopheles triannulatus TaxID=58253 RepID=A0A2M4B6P1_9DIPT
MLIIALVQIHTPMMIVLIHDVPRSTATLVSDRPIFAVVVAKVRQHLALVHLAQRFVVPIAAIVGAIAEHTAGNADTALAPEQIRTGTDEGRVPA